MGMVMMTKGAHLVKLARKPARSHREQTLSCGEGLPLRRQASWTRLDEADRWWGVGALSRLASPLSRARWGSRTGVVGRVSA